MSHQSLYRKYRPATFEDVVGQSHIERTLRNAVATNSVAHAYLFSGPRGTGKTTTARLLAAALVCDHTQNGEPDGSCEQCQQISEGHHPDVIELDAASQTGVDNVREEIINNMHLATVYGKSKVYIIDEVHMLSTSAFNALLKTLEEPPPKVVFVLCTTDPQKVLSTVRSRCQEFDFHPIAVSDITQRLAYIAEKEGITADPQALELIARHAEGGMRDAITLFEQMNAYSGGDIKVSDVEESMGGVSGDSLANLMDILARRDTPACFSWVNEQVTTGADLNEAVRALLDYARDLYVLSVLGKEAGGVNRSEQELQTLARLSEAFAGPEHLERLLDLLFDLSDKLRWSTEPRILVEMTLARATNSVGDFTLEALAERIERLEQGVPVAAAVAAPAATVPVAAPVALAAVPAVAEPAPAAPEPAPAAATAPEWTPEPEAPQPTPVVKPVASPESQAEPAAPAVAGQELSSDLPTLNRNWSSILDHIRAANSSVYPIFADARLRVNQLENSLVVGFSHSDSFKYQQAMNPETRALLTDAVAATYGKDMACALELDPEGATAAFAAVSATAPKESVPTPAPASYGGAPAYEPVPSYDDAPAYEPTADVADAAPAVAAAEPATDSADDATAATISEPSILEPTPPPDSRAPQDGKTLEVSAILDELDAVTIRESSQ